MRWYAAAPWPTKPVRTIKSGNRLSGFLKLAAILLAGTALGLGATHLAVGGQPLLGGVRSGAWTAWPTSGSADADPYARAVFAEDGRIPLAAAAGLLFLAESDDVGAPLDGRCIYSIGGPTPQAQFWTLTRLDSSGFVHATPAQRAGFTSAEIVRDAAGDFDVTAAATAHPGNWLPVPAYGDFLLMLTFYDTPLTTALQTGNPATPLPRIVKQSCR